MAKDNPEKIYLTLNDYSVSGEEFQLVENSEFGFLETTPQPASNKLSYYYKSDDYISHTDSKRNFFEKGYHLIRKVSLKRKLNLINKFSNEGKNLLDIGCGTGDFLLTAQQNNWKVLGIEPNEQAKKIANSKTNNAVYNVDQLSKLDEFSFDVITLWHVLEHLPNLEDQLKVFKKLLKPKGTLIIAVPNYNSFDAKHYKNFWAAYDVPRHLWHFNKKSISKLVSKQYMEIHNIKPMWFDSFYVSLLSEKYKTGKMNFLKGFLIGFISNLKAYATKEYSSLIYIVRNT
ncbi:class I SAM-dependent methyltransferase [Litoribaculum gwangyangense]|uniref:Class I SAM-dependent methyltransferase n=1 Tax=Litoribaculum gwangyangense TaxID=1130722 RepID=A0ABP9BZ78_9FLAO